MPLIKDKQVFGWTMYDWANSSFATTVMAGFFPVFFKSYWSAGADVNVSTAMLGYANSIGSLFVAFLSPILGAIADQSSSKKRFLIFFAYLGVLMTTCLFMVDYGQWLLAAFLYVLGSIGFAGANTFYDGLLPDIASPKKIDYVSAKGFALGYLGGGLLFLVNVLWYLKPGLFGFPVEQRAFIHQPLTKDAVVIQIEPNRDFTIPQNQNIGRATVSSEIVLPIMGLTYHSEDTAVMHLQIPAQIDQKYIEKLITFGKYKRGELLLADSIKGEYVIAGLTQRLTKTDSARIIIKNPITYRGFHDQNIEGVAGLVNHIGKTSITTDFLAPAREYLPIRISFLSVGLWWAIFTIPLIKYVKESRLKSASSQKKKYFKLGFGQLVRTFRQIRHLKVVFLFLMAYWLYIDGVDTIIRMSVDYGMSIGFPSSSLIVALLIVQFVGFPAALIFGKLAEKWDPKKALFVTIAVYLGVTTYAVLMKDVKEFYILAIVIGLVQGGIQAISRSYYSRLIPREQSAEFYGFYNMLGKFSVIFGPFLIGTVGLLVRRAGYSANLASRVGIGSISILFLAGAIFLYFVDEKKGRAEVEHLHSLN
ncbi:MAG: MFS transporter [Candidatus Neomarinimicrobiota bacterium]